MNETTEPQKYLLLALFENPQLWIPLKTLAEQTGMAVPGGITRSLGRLRDKSMVTDVRNEANKCTEYQITEFGAEYVRKHFFAEAKGKPAQVDNTSATIMLLQDQIAKLEKTVEATDIINEELERRFGVLYNTYNKTVKEVYDRLGKLTENLNITDKFARTHFHKDTAAQFIKDAKLGGARTITIDIQ